MTTVEQIGSIYKIVPNNPLDDGDVYFGSTELQLDKRYKAHVSWYKSWKNHPDKIRKVTVFNIFDKYGVENCKIELINICRFSDKSFLYEQEKQFIVSHACVNKRKPNFNRLQYYQDNREHISKYYQDNREDKLKYQKEYHQRKKERLNI